MPSIERSALVMHSTQEMFDLVNDVQRYPEFLPWCIGSDLISDSEDELVARLDVSKAGIHQSFTTRNEKQSPNWMTMELVDGPFKVLNGQFIFKALSDEACKVTLKMNFEVAGKILSLTLTPVFKQVANTMVDSFVKRADAIYSKKDF